LGLVLSPSDSPLSVVTVIPTSTSAGPSIHRPEFEIAGRPTRMLVDALSVLVRSELDEHEVLVGPDGVVLALLRAPRHGRLGIVVRTANGDVVRTTPS